MINGLKILWLMLSPAQRRSSAALLVFMLIGMGLEMLGIGLIIPILTVMTKGDLLSDYPMLLPWAGARVSRIQAQGALESTSAQNDGLQFHRLTA